MSEKKQSDSPVGRVFDVLIVGTGFGGLCAAIELQRAGVTNLVILERGGDVGGVWRENSYPGSACDVPSHLYSFSFEPSTRWSHKYGRQNEIFEYLKHCASKYRVNQYIQFHQEVASMQFDDKMGVWSVLTTSGKRYRARIVVGATGQLDRPSVPNIEGQSLFDGRQFHSARWDHNYDLTNKKVAVIGTGASAIQFVPQIVPKVQKLYLFQRHPPYILPKTDRVYSPLEQRVFKKIPVAIKVDRAMQYWQHEYRALGVFRFQSMLTLPKLHWRWHIGRQIADKELIRKLTPDYPVACKRVLISNDYYPALAQSHVDVVTDSVAEIDHRGVITTTGQRYDVDAIIYGTGFDTTHFLGPIKTMGLRDINLAEQWSEGAEAYLGMTVKNFPNLLLIYGPNTNLGHSSIVFMIEAQVGYLVQYTKEILNSPGVAYLDVHDLVHKKYNDWVQERSRHSVWEQGCTSWYKTANGKQTNNWPGFTFEYLLKVRRFRPRDYRIGFR